MELDHEPTETYHCQGCNATTDSREMMERHEAGCVLALRASVAAAEARERALREAAGRLIDLIDGTDDYDGVGLLREDAAALRAALQARGEEAE